ncbi:DUF7503 family protein [Salarchaeum japonicum]
MSDHNALTAYLKNNPRFIGVLFTMTVLLSQTGAALAAKDGVLIGP